MIDFRYHVVSIVAVFLALATGIVLGTSLLNEPLLKSLRAQNARVEGQKAGLRDQVRQLQGQTQYLDGLTQQVEPGLAAGRLQGQSVVVVRLPGSGRDVQGSVSKALKEAGARTTATVTVTDSYTDPTKQNMLDDLVTRLVLPGVKFPPAADVYGRAAAELAAALVARDTAPAGQLDANRSALLAGFKDLGLLDYDGIVQRRATLAVLVTGPAPDLTEASTEERTANEQANAALVSLATGLDAGARGTVVAGEDGSGADGGVVAALRGDGTAAAAVSSVDAAATAAGRISLVYALEAELRGQSGHYGTSGSDGPLPAKSSS